MSTITFQEIIQNLNNYWAKNNCIVAQPYGVEVGAGTSNPQTFFRSLGPEPYNVAYVEPCRRPEDGRYGKSKYRLQHYFQYQVILKPAPENNIQLYINSLKELGISPTEHDLRFVEDNWESAPLGAWGLGWEIWLNGMEITQYTYFQQFARVDLPLPCIEMTYGLERIAMFLQNVDDYRDIKWNNNITYGEIFEKHEYWQSKHNFQTANVDELTEIFHKTEKLAEEQITKHQNYFAAYDYVLKLSHLFNILDARGAVSLHDRTTKFKKMGNLSRKIAKLYLEERESLNYPFKNKNFLENQFSDKKISITTTPQDNNKENKYILELGFEEFPAQYLVEWIKQIPNQAFNKYAENILQDLNLQFDSVQLSFTPTRIALKIVEPKKLTTYEENIKGPLKNICYKDGEPTDTLKGFRKSFENNIIEESIIKEDEKEFIHLTIKKELKLQEIINQFIKRLLDDAPKTKFMHWNDKKDCFFIRPLRWILSYYNDETIPLKYFDIKSDNYTKTPRFTDPIKVTIDSAMQYEQFLKEYEIILDHKKRKETIASTFEMQDKQYVYSPDIEKYLLINTFLTEKPVTEITKLEEKYQKLPIEVITKVLENNQRHLVRWDKNNKKNIEYGIVVNGQTNKQILEGHILSATGRLDDALFYFNNDLKKNFPKRSKLKNIIYIPTLKNNTYYHKAERIKQISQEIWKQIYKKKPSKEFTNALNLIKNIKATELINEIPELEPVLGSKLIDLLTDHSPKTGKIVDEHYLPNNQNERLPTLPESTIISIADKIDNLVSLTASDNLPKGSNDPFEARKNLYNLLEILFNQNIIPSDQLNLKEIIELNFKLLDEPLKEKQKEKLEKELLSFMKNKIYQIFKNKADNENILHELLAKGIAFSTSLNLTHKKELFNNLQAFSDNKLESILDALKRIQNILKKPSRKQEVNKDLLKTSSEKKLNSFIKEKQDNLLIDEDFEKLAKLLELFFEETIVNTDNKKLATNRQALLHQLQNLTDKSIKIVQ